MFMFSVLKRESRKIEEESGQGNLHVREGSDGVKLCFQNCK